MAIKITTPQEGYTGTDTYGPLTLEFVDGVAVTQEKLSDGHRAYFKRHGFKVSSFKSDAEKLAELKAEEAKKEAEAKAEAEANAAGLFDPSQHTVEEVREYLDNIDDTDPEKHDAELSRVVEAEKAGQNRKTLIEYVEGIKEEGEQ